MSDGEETPSATPPSTTADEFALVGHGSRARTPVDIPHVAETVAEILQVEEQAASTRVRESGVSAWLFRPDAEPVPVALAEVPELVRDDAHFVWIDLSEYGERELREIADLLDLHEGAVHATLSPWQRPSLVAYRDHFLVSATVARPDPGRLRVYAGEMDIIAGDNVLISAHKLALPFHERVLARARYSRQLLHLDSAFMLYILLDELLAYYDELNRHLQTEIERMEERALHDASDEFLERLLQFRRYAFALFQLAEQHREVFSAFLRPDFHWVSGTEVEAYFRDLDARLSHLLGMLLAARDAINGAFDIYVSHISHRTNQIIKVLTMVSVVLLPATLIIYLFGVNLTNSIRSPSVASPGGLAVMVLIMLLVSGGILWTFRHRGWF